MQNHIHEFAPAVWSSCPGAQDIPFPMMRPTVLGADVGECREAGFPPARDKPRWLYWSMSRALEPPSVRSIHRAIQDIWNPISDEMDWTDDDTRDTLKWSVHDTAIRGILRAAAGMWRHTYRSLLSRPRSRPLFESRHKNQHIIVWKLHK